jgi:hypothetical protein
MASDDAPTHGAATAMAGEGDTIRGVAAPMRVDLTMADGDAETLTSD